MKPGLELNADGTAIGRDPRNMDEEDFRQAGHEKMTPVKTIRQKCIDCSGGSTAEVRTCTAVDCALWPYRMGSSPFRKPVELSEEEKARRIARLRKDT